LSSETRTAEERAALLEALKILSRRDYFREELRRKLQRKAFSAASVNAALERCEELGYLGDEALAKRFAESRALNRGWSPRKIRAELQKRGVEEALAREASALDEELRRVALKKALRRAESRAAEGWWRGGDGRRPLLSSLLRRGFDAEESFRAVDELAAERERQHDEATDEPGNPEEFS